MGDFRQRHVAALAKLFVQGLRVCQAAGLVKVGPVAVEGTKIKAKASKHTAMSYGRRAAAEQKLDQEGKTLLEQAQARAAAADAGYGTEKRGDELPAELARRESRLRTIREAQAALAQEAKPEAEAAAAAAQAKLAARQRDAAATGQKAQGRAPTVPDPAQARPEAKAQRTFTAPDSRMMKDGATTAFEQADTAQTAVASQAPIIVAAAVTPEANDKPQLVPMLGAVEANLGAVPEKASADTGVFSEATLTAKAVEGVDLSGPPERSPPPSLTRSSRWQPRRRARCARRCGTSSKRRKAKRSTGCAKPSASPSLARSKRAADSAVSGSGAWPRWRPSGASFASPLSC